MYCLRHSSGVHGKQAWSKGKQGKNTVSISNIINISAAPVSLHLVRVAAFDDWLGQQGAEAQQWISVSGFKAKSGTAILLPDAKGSAAMAVACFGPDADLWTWSAVAEKLPAGDYELVSGSDIANDIVDDISLGWALAAYRFDRYLDDEVPARACLIWPATCDRAAVEAMYAAVSLTRDLVNTPAADLGPAELATIAGELAEANGASFHEIVGDDLVTENYPMVHAVGRASDRAPRLIDLGWGDEDHPKVTLVGKGVCFDSGGLDLKPASGMEIMKKDMGGAATVLGLASLIMSAVLPVRLRVLIPAVENAVSGNAFRPGDILQSRNGLTVEIGNTDAEGRLVLADALTEAVTDDPELLIDCATLTGAARVALGPELPAFFTDDEDLAADLAAQSSAVSDPLWRLPLWRNYREMFETRVADINNAGAGGFAGAITAALFLQYFTEKARTWVHFDLYAWSKKSRPGRPAGGEAQAMRALFAVLQKRFGA
jgi:leucyl aminopeptidase